MEVSNDSKEFLLGFDGPGGSGNRETIIASAGEGSVIGVVPTTSAAPDAPPHEIVGTLSRGTVAARSIQQDAFRPVLRPAREYGNRP